MSIFGISNSFINTLDSFINIFLVLFIIVVGVAVAVTVDVWFSCMQLRMGHCLASYVCGLQFIHIYMCAFRAIQTNYTTMSIKSTRWMNE